MLKEHNFLLISEPVPKLRYLYSKHIPRIHCPESFNHDDFEYFIHTWQLIITAEF